MFQETRLDVGSFIYLLFVIEGSGIKEEVASMPGIYRYSPDLLSREAEEISQLGIPLRCGRGWLC
jgi:porphobilinogen synthase